MNSRRRCLVAGALMVALSATTACATARTRPTAAPSRDSLMDFLARSPDALAIEEAARAEGLLAGSESDIKDLEVAAEALGIQDIDVLSERVAAVAGETPLLFAALDERRRGNRTGDTAHWVAVALLALDDDDPMEQHLRADIDWQTDYIDDVLDLRRLSHAGGLAEIALGEAEREPEPYQVTIVPRLTEEQRPIFSATEDRGYWPVFAGAGSRAISGTIALERRQPLEFDQLRVLVRRPGSATVIAVPEQPPPRFRLADDGTLTPAGTIELALDQNLAVLVQIPGRSTLALLEPGQVVELPWEVNCCHFHERGEAEWWARLSSGAAAGGWVLASADAFRTAYPALEAAWRREREHGSTLRLGPLRRAGTIDVYGGARLAYWLTGSADKPPVMVLHGGPGWGSRYLQEPLSTTLGRERLLYLYDQRGSGYSEGGDDPELLTLERAVLDLDQMRRAAQLERVDLLGHGFGGLVALRYAATYPEHVDRLVLVEPEPLTRTGWKMTRQRLQAHTSPEDSTQLAEIEAMPGWDEDPMVVAAWFATRMRAYMSVPGDARVSMRFDQLTLPNYRSTPALVREALGDWDMRGDLALVGAPTLIVAGADSIFLPAMQEIVDGIPRARLETIEDTGHFPFLEASSTFNALVTAFLER